MDKQTSDAVDQLKKKVHELDLVQAAHFETIKTFHDKQIAMDWVLQYMCSEAAPEQARKVLNRLQQHRGKVLITQLQDPKITQSFDGVLKHLGIYEEMLSNLQSMPPLPD